MLCFGVKLGGANLISYKVDLVLKLREKFLFAILPACKKLLKLLDF